MKKKYIFLGVTLSFVSIAGSNATAQQLECFGRICVNPESVSFNQSRFPGAPSYEVREFYGTTEYNNGPVVSEMEVDCEERQFRTVRVKNGRRWRTSDPRWTLVGENDTESDLGNLVNYICEMPLDE
ncbi:hypothetical protein [Microcoleus sp. FACHB-68]|uniref:hypothetical protein n=1 Tax=Microcoleus sp. FACHB-68 TaxID=2692826 RepID=UPI001688AA89|nr:hypothetical protein [Microcoleus sp. FACHB-68]MBD1938878.1 hypothetical protein [Microcoleus sp. FACHB-68]